MNTETARPASPAPPSAHYENFPVASLLCPPRLRPPIAAIYWFARTADDIADEGDATPGQRLDDLAVYRQDLHAIAGGRHHSGRWPQVFDPLQKTLHEHDLPVPLLADLLSAFEQDVVKTRDGAGYADRTELLDYCRRSANPVGRLLLHLYGVRDAQSLAQSDNICSALQLINFWQDMSVDIPRGRFYLPVADSQAYGVLRQDLQANARTPGATTLVAELVRWARAMMQGGAALVHTVPGRAGWELRLVVQGGLRILERIEAIDHATLLQRPVLRAWDWPLVLWRALWM
ncbi:MAG TPA: squalene synthase HpnC [Burkholderiaceae bacterium]|nr:squalene synthase HpnC [Burkholderiaceae bacterium]